MLVYLRLLRVNAVATAAMRIAVMAVMAMYSVMDGAWLLGGGATEGDVEVEVEAEGEADAGGGVVAVDADVEGAGVEVEVEACVEAEGDAVTAKPISAVELQ
jgi:hypothetical protein